MAICCSPDGRYLISGSKDKTIKIWLLPQMSKEMGSSIVNKNKNAQAIDKDYKLEDCIVPLIDFLNE